MEAEKKAMGCRILKLMAGEAQSEQSSISLFMGVETSNIVPIQFACCFCKLAGNG
jgi:hypothetical protein